MRRLPQTCLSPWTSRPPPSPRTCRRPPTSRASQPAPDHAEEDLADVVDDAVPSRSYEMLPMVGLGGSAGSIAALQGFFAADAGRQRHGLRRRHAPVGRARERARPDHPARDHDAGAAGQRDRAQVEANHVYVIPPGKTLSSANGHLTCGDLSPERGRRVAVDLFFRTLADTHGPHAAAIVLSGADGDGAIGIKRIKERGGLTIAQDPERGRALRHAALGDRHRHGRLGAAGRRHAVAPGRRTRASSAA